MEAHFALGRLAVGLWLRGMTGHTWPWTRQHCTIDHEPKDQI